jgi:hypothetical protein
MQPLFPGVVPSIDPERLGVPCLDRAWGVETVEGLPTAWHKWGSSSRRERAEGKGVHFYEYDYRWSALLKHPERLIAYGCPVCVEPNPSTFPGQPLIEALYGVYQRRRVACRWGRAGIRVLVDLNVSVPVLPLALLGVPRDYPSYATRAHRDGGTEAIRAQYEAATAHRGGSVPPVFVVFGGGRRVQELCQARGWPNVPEHRETVKPKVEVDHGERGRGQ